MGLLVPSGMSGSQWDCWFPMGFLGPREAQLRLSQGSQPRCAHSRKSKLTLPGAETELSLPGLTVFAFVRVTLGEKNKRAFGSDLHNRGQKPKSNEIMCNTFRALCVCVDCRLEFFCGLLLLFVFVLWSSSRSRESHLQLRHKKITSKKQRAILLCDYLTLTL